MSTEAPTETVPQEYTRGRVAVPRRGISRGRIAGIAIVSALALVATLIMATATMMTMVGGGGESSTGFDPSALAVADIPTTILPIYLKAGETYGVDWAIVAAIGKIETDHGRSTAPGVHSGVNFAKCCAGPVQFSIIGAGGGTWGAYGVDGDGDGDKDVYDPADAIPAAARYLKASGAPADNERAIFAYNHASWYVAEVLAQAEKYRGAMKNVGGGQPLVVNRENASAVLALARGPHPRITMDARATADLSTGQIDGRVSSLLVAIARAHTFTIVVLKTGHSYLTASGNPSNHVFGRAVDIGVVDGVKCDSTRQGRSGACWQLAQEIARIRGPLLPTELIYGIDPDGPGPAFAQPDHWDHVHAGWDG